MFENAVLSWQEAVSAFTKKNIRSKEFFYGLSDEARGEAWTLGKLQDFRAMLMVKDKLAIMIKEGRTVADFEEWITTDKKGKKLGLAALGKSYNELVFRNAVMGSYSKARQDAMDDPAAKVEFPFLFYDAINDSRTRPSHAAMDGTVWRRDKFPQEWMPPNGHNCRCEVRAINQTMMRKLGLEIPKDDQVVPGGVVPDKGWQANQNTAGAAERLANEQKAALQAKIKAELDAVAAPVQTSRPHKPLEYKKATDQRKWDRDYKAWFESLSSQEIECLYEYTDEWAGMMMEGSSIQEPLFLAINDALRGEIPWEPWMDKVRDLMDNSIGRGVLKNDVWLWRGDGLQMLGGTETTLAGADISSMTVEQVRDMLVGHEFKAASYSSCSYFDGTASLFAKLKGQVKVRLKIAMYKGDSGAYLGYRKKAVRNQDDYEENPRDYFPLSIGDDSVGEVLLPRDARFRVIGYEREGDMLTFIVEHLGGG